MANKKYIIFDLNDKKLNVLADILSNKTSKNILEYLADKEASETEIARDLGIPANTVNYNIKKLLEANLIEIAKVFFWSVKGKKILRYRVANKKILISPKISKDNLGLLSAFLLTGIVAFFIKVYSSNFLFVNNERINQVSNIASGSAGIGIDSAKISAQPFVHEAITSSTQIPEIASWFLLGGIFALIVFLILNWRKL